MATLGLTSDNRLKLKCDYLERELAKKIPNASWSKQDLAWYYPFSKERIVLFKKYFPDGIVMNSVKEAELQQSALEKRLMALKDLKDCEIPKLDIKEPLRNHQKVGVNYLLQLNSAMLADEMGAGKSLQAIVVALIRKHKNEVKKCLIVCPATTKYSVWKREIERFTDEKCLVIDGVKKKREETYHTFFERDDIFFLIINYESLNVDSACLARMPFDSICIADESVYIKTHKAQRTKALKKIPIKHKIALTGYPVANKIIDLHSQFDWLMPGFLGSFWSFQDRYLDFFIIQKRHTNETKSTGKNCKCVKCGKWSPEQKYAGIYTCQCDQPEWEQPNFRKLVGYKNLDELRRKIEPYYIRRLKSDILADLPDKIYEEREVELFGELLKAYNEMKEDMRVQIKNMHDEDVIAKANSILIQMLRLSQLTCGFITDKNLKHPNFYKENPKVSALDEIIDEVINSGQKIVIWTRFRAFMGYLLKRYSEGFKYEKEFRQYKCTYLWGGMSAKEKDDNINAFQTDPETKIIVGTVQTGGLGVTLHAGSVEVFTDLSFLSPSTVLQAESRCHRIGQKNSVVIIKLIAKNSVDSHWLNLLESKQKASRMIFTDDMSVKIRDKDTLLELLE